MFSQSEKKENKKEEFESIEIYAKVLPGLLQFSDQNDECMRAAVKSFLMTSSPPANSNTNFFTQPQQAIFYLNDLNLISTKLISTSDLTPYPELLNKEFLLTGCAIESILKKLYQNNCINKDAVTFRMSRSSSKTKDVKIYPPLPQVFILNPKRSVTDKINIAFKEDTISHVDAYLDEKKICIFFNSLSLEQEKNIRDCLSDLFGLSHQLTNKQGNKYDIRFSLS